MIRINFKESRPKFECNISILKLLACYLKAFVALLSDTLLYVNSQFPLKSTKYKRLCDLFYSSSFPTFLVYGNNPDMVIRYFLKTLVKINVF